MSPPIGVEIDSPTRGAMAEFSRNLPADNQGPKD